MHDTLMENKLYDLLTYIIETTPTNKLDTELGKITMTKNEYENLESLSYHRVCELVWIMKKYLDLRGDECELDNESYIKLKNLYNNHILNQ